MQRTAHSLKGELGYLGVLKISQLARELEEAGRKNDLRGAVNIFRSLEHELTTLLYRTRELLRTALLSLIEEKGFEGASVQNIIDRANVGRATFYAHFDNKEDLLVSGLDGLRAALKAHQAKAHSHRGASDERLFAYSHEMFAHIAEYRTVFRAMVGKQSGALIQQLLHKIIVDLVRDDVRAMGGRRDDELDSHGGGRPIRRGRPLRASNVVGGWETAAICGGGKRALSAARDASSQGSAELKRMRPLTKRCCSARLCSFGSTRRQPFRSGSGPKRLCHSRPRLNPP